MQELSHISVLLNEISEFARQLRTHGDALSTLSLLDATAGGGGHFFELLKVLNPCRGQCWDRDSRAETRIHERAKSLGIGPTQYHFYKKTFGEGPEDPVSKFDFILADLGISSFQIDDPVAGMSLFSEAPVDFRMNINEGLPFGPWLKQHTESEIADYLFYFGEEPRSRRLARAIMTWGPEVYGSAKIFSDRVAGALGYHNSKTHPATRTFQALRIAVNDELGQLDRLLEWAPASLNPGGMFLVISFHSLEDRRVKNHFRDLVKEGPFDILTKKPMEPSDDEVSRNRRSRSAKLRVLVKKNESSTAAYP